MAMKANFNFGDIEKKNQQFLDKVLLSVEKVMIRSIIEVVNFAKNTNTYTDRTNNLRSSIGYVLYKDGEKISASFEKSGGGDEGNGSDGTAKGETFADKVAKNFPSGYVVVLVAGMGYAAYVEAKGYDVVTGAGNRLDPAIKKNFEAAKNVIFEKTGINLNEI